MPKLSVIVPVYNTEKYLRECINSILAQTFTDFELILVDDGSTDRSGVICDEYANKDKRIRVIHQENGGVTVARRSGIQIACGEYMAFVDSDDWISQDMYQDMMAKAEAYGTDMVLCDIVVEMEADHTVVCGNSLWGLFGKEQLTQQIYGSVLFDFTKNRPGVSLSLCNKLIKGSLVKCAFAALPDELTYGEDVAGTLLCILEAKCIYIMNDAAEYHYRQSAEFLSRERSLSLLQRLSDFANTMQMILVKYNFMGDDQLAGYVAQISLYCIRHILLFNEDYTLRKKINVVKLYLQEPHIRKLLIQAESVVINRKMKTKLNLVNQGHYLLLLILYCGKEIMLRFKRCLCGDRGKQ